MMSTSSAGTRAVTENNPANGTSRKSSPKGKARVRDAFVVKCVQVLIKAAECYGFDSKGVRMSGMIQRHLHCARAVGDPIKYMKYKISAYFAANMCEEELETPARPVGLPESDQPKHMFGGKLYSWLKMKMLDADFRRSWCTTVLYSKGGMPRPWKRYVVEKVNEAYKKLTTPVNIPQSTKLDTRSWADLDEEEERSPLPRSLLRMAPTLQVGLVTRQAMMDQISRTAQELFSGNEYSEEVRNRPFFPSTSANYINSRSDGGAVGHLRTVYGKIINSLNRSREAAPSVSVTRMATSGVCTSELTGLRVVESSLLRSRFGEFMDMMKGEAVRERPVAEPLGLQEALKVRVITKGPPVLNTYLKPLQKFLWRIMSKHPMFVLTGKPVDEWSIQDRLGAKLSFGQKFLSVDYEDATNGMYSDCSNIAVDAISDAIGLDSVDRSLFKRSLTGHIIEHPVTGEQLPQVRGQLMGSITSFIVLCVVNGSILRWVKELDDRRVYSLRDCGALVNGDDGLLRCTSFGKMYWEQISSFCGLKPSVGKVYFTDEFANINSTNFRYDRVGREVQYVGETGRVVSRKLYFSRTKFLRLSLLYGLQRSAGTTNASAPITSLGSQCRELVAFCPIDIKERVLKSWMSLHREAISDTHIPWFIPEDLGGLGLPILETDDPLLLPSDLDLRLARKIHDHPNLFRRPLAPTPGAWFVWKVAKAQARKLGVLFTDDERRHLQMSFPDVVDTRRFRPVRESELMNLLVADSFLSNRSLADSEILAMDREQLAIHQQSVAKSYIREWSHVYSQALMDRSVKLPEPYNISKFPKMLSIVDGPVAVVDTLQLTHLHTHAEIGDRVEDPWSFDNSLRRIESNNDDSLWGPEVALSQVGYYGFGTGLEHFGVDRELQVSQLASRESNGFRVYNSTV